LAFESLLRGLTHKNPKKRLGHNSQGGAEEIKNHKFFKGIDWAKVDNKEYAPPVVPEKKVKVSQLIDIDSNPYILLNANVDKKVLKKKLSVFAQPNTAMIGGLRS